jgi:hypothetical protein
MTTGNVPAKLRMANESITEQIKQDKDSEHHKHEALIGHLREQVISNLGQPVNLLQLQVRMLWEKHYRVNVLIGPDVVSGKVANSYFLTTDADGNIVQSIPKISRQY